VSSRRIEDVLRELAPQVLAALVRRGGDFETSEDAVQEALLAAAGQWPAAGLPDDPRAWLITVASRRRIEAWRRDAARRRREEHAAILEPLEADGAALDDGPGDDSLTLLLLCCHPSLTQASQVALTLRAVGGLTTAEIARAFLVPEATVAQRISRAKQRIRETGAEFRLPPPGEVGPRLDAVLQVLYLVFNEGYASSSGPELVRAELTTEAIRLTRQLRTARPDDGEIAGLLALMLLTEARRGARSGPGGRLIPLAEQDRERWERPAIDEGIALVTTALAEAPIGPYQLQAAIAAVHAEARRAEDTDWPQILVLYDHLARLAPGPMVTLNRVVARSMVHGPTTALEALDVAAREPGLAGHHRVDAVRGHLLEQAGRPDAAREAYQRAAQRTLSVPEREYLASRAARLAPVR
jgi:RNA polymerase sigma factor (sigma-70 family)